MAVSQLKNSGAGHPDFGLFAIPSKGPVPTNFAGLIPDRGVCEVKAPSADLNKLVAGKQVSKYWQHYKQVLVTNLWEFAFIGEDAQGKPVTLDYFQLAADEAQFWRHCLLADAYPAATQDAFLSFLSRCLTHAAPLDQPRDLAWLLAYFAREARDLLETADFHALGPLRDELQETLRVKFEGPKGRRFLAATIVQTLFYGVFSAWTLWHHEKPGRNDVFDWRTAPDYLRVPTLQALYEKLGAISIVNKLGLRSLLDRTGLALARVRRDRFFRRFEQTEAIQYFYEPFLEAYDPQLRKEMGVWYTPPQLVRYMVAQVDHALRTELGIEDGLASDDVHVLDPCCGTGTYLLEVLRLIYRRLGAETNPLAALKLREAATKRLAGFELMPGPLVVAHMQIGLALQSFGAPLGPGERANVVLTNSLTGWTPTEHQKQVALSPAFAQEIEHARQVKQENKILVVLGNPAYDGFTNVGIDEEKALMDVYRHPKRAALPQGQGLNDLYVRFFRVAERCIAERTGRGVVCLVTNNSWLEGLSHTGMRERLLDAFHEISIDNLNGDKRRTGKTTPDGKPDPSIFTSSINSAGIQVGTAVALMVRREIPPTSPAALKYRDFWGRNKLAELQQHADYLNKSAEDELNLLDFRPIPTEAVTPLPALGLAFLPRTVGASYLETPTLPELFPASFSGIQTSRDEGLVSIDKSALEKRMNDYFDPNQSNAKLSKSSPSLFKATRRFDPDITRSTLLQYGYGSGRIMQYLYRPFDVRWVYWHPFTKLVDEKRPEYLRHLEYNSVWLEAMQANRKEYCPPCCSSIASSFHVNERGTNFFPLYLAPDAASAEPQYNLSNRAWKYLLEVDEQPETLLFHAIAVLHSPKYRVDNAGALQQSWPRVPLPSNPATLRISANLGREVAALLDAVKQVEGISKGKLNTDVYNIANIKHIDTKCQLDPNKGHFEVRAKWGTLGHTGQTMPGQGKTTKKILDSIAPLGLSGQYVYDVYLNNEVYWGNIPDVVWEYRLGGYQVLKKWLSYRSISVLGRALTLTEVEEFSKIAKRIAALLMLTPKLDKNYQAMLAPVEESEHILQPI